MYEGGRGVAMTTIAFVGTSLFQVGGDNLCFFIELIQLSINCTEIHVLALLILVRVIA